ncbi:torsin-1A-like isoform X2 [Bacillus rossius redtenbacheri]|uniref:torsin-1A-like isoform X2 n=1 Tax=Bacillus rossius redtenbacheri TaxID=93214 RepID=UPI002FDCBC1A
MLGEAVSRAVFWTVSVAAVLPAAGFVDPFTLGAIGLGSAALFGYKLLSCKMSECCDTQWIPANFSRLEQDLSVSMFGQHLVRELVLSAVKGHFRAAIPKKALTLSFHGPPGVGKNYVAQFLMDGLYKMSHASQYVHFFSGKKHFPLQEEAAIYRMHLQDWVRGNVSNCGRSLFVFDEVDKMPRGVLDGLKPFLDYHKQIDGVDFRKAVFIFISNTGGHLIIKRHLELWASGKKREALMQRDFEYLIREGAFNEKGGFHKSETIESDLIDHYVPFLPLEESHVKLCIAREFRHSGVLRPHEDHITEILKDVTFGPPGSMKFSSTGCKRIAQKVVALVEKLRPDSDPL